MLDYRDYNEMCRLSRKLEDLFDKQAEQSASDDDDDDLYETLTEFETYMVRWRAEYLRERTEKRT